MYSLRWGEACVTLRVDLLRQDAYRMTARSRSGRKGAKHPNRRKRRASTRAVRVSSSASRTVAELLKRFALGDEDFAALAAFSRLNPAARVADSRKVIQGCIIETDEKPRPMFAAAVSES